MAHRMTRLGACRSTQHRARGEQKGMLLIGVLVFLTLAALTAVNTGQRWFDARQRAAEEELLFVGEQYRQAIESYWREAPNTVHQMPTRIEDLLSDNRFPFPKRHLRKAFLDPLAPHQSLAELRDGATLIGVYSQAEGSPFRQAGFEAQHKGFNQARTYADWKFNYVPPAVVAPARGKAPGVKTAPGTPGAPGRPGVTPPAARPSAP